MSGSKLHFGNVASSAAAETSSRKLRVLYMLNNLGGGGAERMALNLAQQWQADDIELKFSLLDYSGAFLDEFPTERLLAPVDRGPFARALEIFPQNLIRLPRAVEIVRRAVSSYRPDVLVTSIQVVSIAAMYALPLTRGKRPVWIVREGSNPLERLAGTFKLRQLKRAYHRTDRVITLTRKSKLQISEGFAISPHKITVIHNPLLLDHIRRAVSEPPEIALDGPYIVAIGRLIHAKGVDTLLRAFAQIADGIPHRLVVLGEGPLRSPLESLAKELGLADRVIMPGFARNPWSVAARADLFVLSSRHEGFPNVLIEAMACGCPIVAADCDFGPRDVLDGGNCGVLVPPDEPAAMAEAMLQTLTDSALRQKLVSASDAQVVNFDAAGIAEEYASLFRRLADSQREAKAA